MALPEQIIHPLGLVGFALSLVFGVVAKKNVRSPKWLMPSAIVLAAVSIVGGLWLERGKSAAVRDAAAAATAASAAAQPKQGPVTGPAVAASSINFSASGPCALQAVGVTVGQSVSINCNNTVSATSPAAGASR
jgi:hypothetical protein